ncbi:MAG TPA: hypothetical protein VFG53_11590 [Anaeromyxobacter sp.]|nr:hypothetical protein [Anaeromyxobacter sp.]
MLRPALALALVLSTSCERAPLPVPPAPAQLVEPERAAPPPPAPGPVPAAGIVREAAALQPGEVTTPMDLEGETTVDPSSTFRVVLSGRSLDARLALFDREEAAVPAAALAEVGETTVLTLSPASPLSPGSRYRLRLDGAVTSDLHLGDRSYTPAIYPLKVAGEPPPPRPARKHRHGQGRAHPSAAAASRSISPRMARSAAKKS